MSWSEAGFAISVTNSGDTTPVEGGPAMTSLCPLLLERGVSSFELRVYGVSSEELTDVGGSGRATPDKLLASDYSNWTNAYESFASTIHIQYVDSGTYPEASFNGTIALDKVDEFGVVSNTAIVASLEGMNFSYFCLNNATTGASLHSMTGDDNGVRLTYKDPHVIALPDQKGYLMALGRYLHLDGVSPDSTNSRSQIVLWWSDTPDFTGANVVGPFVLVDDLRSWLPEQTIRLWVGVPGIVLVDREVYGLTLYVYYAIDESGVGFGGDCPLMPELGWSEDGITSSQYQDALSALGELWGEFRPGVACKRFDWEELWGVIKAEADHEEPTYMTTQEFIWWPNAIDGDLLGLVNFYFSEGTYEDLGFNTPALVVTPFFDVYETCVRAADPHPLMCGDRQSSLSLYVAMTVHEEPRENCTPSAPTASTAGTGHGLWRARSAPHGRWMVNPAGEALPKSVLGRDFILAPVEGGSSPDLIAASSSEQIWLDPGAVQLEDGRIWVIAGQQNNLTNSIGENAAFLGSATDGCMGWQALYRTLSKDRSGLGRMLEPPGLPEAPGLGLAALRPRPARASRSASPSLDLPSR